MKKYTDVDIVAELQKLVDSHVDSYKAVSYTHLDVYKRQEEASALRCGDPSG